MNNYTQVFLEDKIKIWCEVLEKKTRSINFSPKDVSFEFSVGKTYYKILMGTPQSTRFLPHPSGKQYSVHAFVNKKTGDIYKPATWSAPYKQVRYNIWTQFDELLQNCDWIGSYLYKRK